MVTLKKNMLLTSVLRVQATGVAYIHISLLHVASVCCFSCTCTCCTANAVVSFALVAYSRAMHATLRGIDHKFPLTGSSRLSSPYASSPSRTFAKRSTRSAPCTKIACQQRPDTGRPVWRQRTDQVGISAAETKVASDSITAP